jgi:hypothetical protein
MSTQQPEALRLADALLEGKSTYFERKAAAELRRLHESNQKFEHKANLWQTEAVLWSEQCLKLQSANAELLEALKDALCALDCCGKDYPAASKARAAIAKATGAQL